MKILLLMGALLLVSCNQEVTREMPRRKNLMKEAAMQAKQEQRNPLSGKVLETMDASKYTYVLVNNGSEKVWIAGPKTKVTVGQKIAAGRGMAMSNFTSKTLDRTFETIYFVSKWLQADVQQGGKVAMESSHGKANDHTKVTSEIFVEKINHGKGEVSIGDLYGSQKKYAGKKVKVKGTVVKFLTAIMGKNWIHIQDGSSDKHPDLTITTAEKVKVGDVISLEGVISLKKDFGFGYFYPVIMENAKVLK